MICHTQRFNILRAIKNTGIPLWRKDSVSLNAIRPNNCTRVYGIEVSSNPCSYHGHMQAENGVHEKHLKLLERWILSIRMLMSLPTRNIRVESAPEGQI